MAQRVSITLVDDIDGSEATETVSFALDGTAYEIDLSKENAETFRVSLDLYVSNARRVASKRRKPAAPRVSPKVVREWARAQGIEVNPRGSISGAVMAQYEAAH